MTPLVFRKLASLRHEAVVVLPKVACQTAEMINGSEIRLARERAGMSQKELASRLGVHERSVGNWERGDTVPRNKMGMIEEVLAEFLWSETRGAGEGLRTASDVALLAEIARRLVRGAEMDLQESNERVRNLPPSTAEQIENQRRVIRKFEQDYEVWRKDHPDEPPLRVLPDTIADSEVKQLRPTPDPAPRADPLAADAEAARPGKPRSKAEQQKTDAYMTASQDDGSMDPR